ncbi:MAG: molybdopterin-dependent oxidoreductase [Microthrixaceae bacterium]|nr:molybdopterin-dependent oxidoreductase [Microthrixaceae bacterium]
MTSRSSGTDGPPAPAARVLASVRAGRDEALTRPVHDDRTLAVLGLALGVCFSICFVTGVLSHLIQNPPGWFTWSPNPAGGYRITQGLHVATGIASIPLLAAKLWAAGPRLISEPAVRNAAHALERISLFPLVGGSIFLLATGLVNLTKWYPWPFGFIQGHFAAAWITIGALVIHILAKVHITRDALRREPSGVARVVPEPEAHGGRRGFLAAVGAGAGAVTLFTVGQTVGPLKELALLAPRKPDVGPQGFPVNRTAKAAGVTAEEGGAGYRLSVTGAVADEGSYSLADLAAMTQREATLPIACVEGWSASARWRGVPVRTLLELAGASADATVRVESLQKSGSYKTSELNPSQIADPDSMLALEVNGEPLHLDHGAPLRLIGPNRPGVQQTKWVTSVVVL